MEYHSEGRSLSLLSFPTNGHFPFLFFFFSLCLFTLVNQCKWIGTQDVNMAICPRSQVLTHLITLFSSHVWLFHKYQTNRLWRQHLSLTNIYWAPSVYQILFPSTLEILILSPYISMEERTSFLLHILEIFDFSPFTWFSKWRETAHPKSWSKILWAIPLPVGGAIVLQKQEGNSTLFFGPVHLLMEKWLFWALSAHPYSCRVKRLVHGIPFLPMGNIHNFPFVYSGSSKRV